MKIIQLMSQYTVTVVYRELLKNIAKNSDVYQEIYIPMRSDKLMNKYRLEHCPENIKYNFSLTYNELDRILYYPRIRKELKDIEEKVSVKQMDYVHAHTLFADGGLAYCLKKKYGIPYIVAVRSTDIAGYLRKMPHCKLYMNRIIKNADQVVFISPNMKKELEQHLTAKMRKVLDQKAIIKPNGISDYWHENSNVAKELVGNGQKMNFIQVSGLDENKNLYGTIKAIEILNQNGIDAKLTVVGTGKEEQNYKKIVKEKQLESKIIFKGYIKDKDQLKELYRENDIFIMLSKHETFGLVYVEAMSQGLPIIHTKGTGVDGYFEQGAVGYPLDIKKIESITDVLKKIIENYSEISNECIKQSKRFDWKRIAESYIEFYQGGSSKT